MSISHVGAFRIYWNRKEDFPFVWSVDFGDSSTERAVTRVDIREIDSCCLQTGVAMGADNISGPRGWLEGIGKVVFENGVAYVSGA